MILQPKRVLIIGGGPCGLVTLRNCLHRGTFSQVQLVERQDDVGGVWYQNHVPAEDHRPRWSTPAYPGLIGNVLPEFLSFSEHPFPVPSPNPFPTFAETNAYIKAFALPFIESGHIRLSHEVIGVEEVQDGGGWRVRIKDWNNGGGVVLEETWDAVVITTVWFDNPYFPDIQGLQELQHRQPSKIHHSMTWTGPHEGHKGKRVLVIGNANSANEIASQLAPIACLPVYRSTRRVSIFPSLPDARIQDIVPITRYSTSTSDKNKITAHVQDGSTIEDIDIVLFGTGYYPHVAYIHVLHPNSLTLAPLTSRTITPSRIPSLHLQILYAHNPTLAFIGATISFIPFLLADLTSTWLALAWSGTIPIPATAEERLDYERIRLDALAAQRAETDNPSNLIIFHFLGRDELSYAQAIRNDIVEIRPELGEVLAKWDNAQDMRRFAMYAAKLDSLYSYNGMG